MVRASIGRLRGSKQVAALLSDVDFRCASRRVSIISTASYPLTPFQVSLVADRCRGMLAAATAAACMRRPRPAKLFAAFLFAALRDPVFDPLHPWRLHLFRRTGTRDQVLHPAPDLLGIERLFQQLAP